MREPDEVEIENLYTIGTIVRIAQVQRGVGGMQLLIQGEAGPGAELRGGEGGAGRGVRPMEEIPPAQPDDPAFLALYREFGTARRSWAAGGGFRTRCCSSSWRG
jgi:ATP-dependent Lon protease